MNLKDRYAIVGIGYTPQGRIPNRTAVRFHLEACANAIIALEEGPQILSNIVGCGSEEVYCDMPVEVTWEEVDKALSLPKFKPARESRDS